MGMLRWMMQGAGWEAGAQAVKKGLEQLGDDDDERRAREEREEAERKQKRNRAIVLVIGGGVGLLVLFALVMKLLKWVLALGLLGAVGAGAYVLLKPKVTSLLGARRERQARAHAARQLASKEQRLEDELAALRARADD